MKSLQSVGRAGIADAVLITMTAFAVAWGAAVEADDAIVSEVRESARSVSPHAGKSLGNVIRTDDRYGHDSLFQGPRGWVYWNFLERPKPIQNPNLWPDMQSTYFIGRFAMPPGSAMTLRGRFPYARFFQFALYRFERETFVAIDESLRGPDFEPDPGSVNPFRVGADRLAEQRNYTIRILAEEAPKEATKAPIFTARRRWPRPTSTGGTTLTREHWRRSSAPSRFTRTARSGGRWMKLASWRRRKHRFLRSRTNLTRSTFGFPNNRQCNLPADKFFGTWLPSEITGVSEVTAVNDCRPRLLSLLARLRSLRMPAAFGLWVCS